MAELMAKHGKDLNPLTKGQEVTGPITKLSSQEIMMQIDGKTDVVIIEKDKRLLKQLLNLLTVGDVVTAVVLYPESDSGYPMVTLRAFIEGKMWQELEKLQKSGEKVPVMVTDSTKGGLLVETDGGVQGFLPNSHVGQGKRPEELVGQKIQASVVELSRENKKVVFSQKVVLTPDDFAKIAAQYKAGTKVSGKVSGITAFGIFVSLPYGDGTVDGLVHISEVSWEKVEDLSQEFSMGEVVEAVVIGMDPRSKRIDLSIKKLSKDPFQGVLDAFPAEKKVTGTAIEMTELGLLVDLGEVDGMEVEGLIKKDKIPPTTTYEKGQKVTATVVSVDSRKRKVMLTPVLLEKPLMYR